MERAVFRDLDHLAGLVRDTNEAPEVWRNRAELPMLDRELGDGRTTGLTHFDLGKTPFVGNHGTAVEIAGVIFARPDDANAALQFVRRLAARGGVS